MALVSPALRPDGWQELARYTRPKLIILGDADSIVPNTQVKALFSDSKDFHIIPGADHFWWGYDGVISDKTGGFLKTHL